MKKIAPNSTLLKLSQRRAYFEDFLARIAGVENLLSKFQLEDSGWSYELHIPGHCGLGFNQKPVMLRGNSLSELRPKVVSLWAKLNPNRDNADWTKTPEAFIVGNGFRGLLLPADAALLESFETGQTVPADAYFAFCLERGHHHMTANEELSFWEKENYIPSSIDGRSYSMDQTVDPDVPIETPTTTH